MNTDILFKIGNIVAWIVAALVFYFGGQATTAADIAVLTARVAVVETKITQEMVGYAVIQSNVGERLARIENKVDCLIDKRLCH